MNKKIKDVLFYTSTSIKPPVQGLETILDNLPVTNYKTSRYSYIMGIKFALPLGIVAAVLVAFIISGIAAKKTATNNAPIAIRELPAKINKENFDASVQQADENVSNSLEEMDQNLKELDQETSQGSADEQNDDNSGDDLNDL